MLKLKNNAPFSEFRKIIPHTRPLKDEISENFMKIGSAVYLEETIHLDA